MSTEATPKIGRTLVGKPPPFFLTFVRTTTVAASYSGGSMEFDTPPRASAASRKSRNVSPGLAARMSMFNTGNSDSKPDSSRKGKGSKEGTPRRAVSPRLRERVDSFSRDERRDREIVSKEAPIVRGVNDRPALRKASSVSSPTKMPTLGGGLVGVGARALAGDGFGLDGPSAAPPRPSGASSPAKFHLPLALAMPSAPVRPVERMAPTVTQLDPSARPIW